MWLITRKTNEKEAKCLLFCFVNYFTLNLRDEIIKDLTYE